MSYRSTKPQLTDRERAACLYIQQNFASLQSTYLIDHEPINTSVGHKQLTFYPIADPSTAVDELVLYGRSGLYGANNNIELCMRRPNNDVINEFTSSQSGSEGWQQSISGVLLKWKYEHSVGAGASGEQTFAWNNAANYPAFGSIFRVFVWVSPDAAGTDPNVMVYATLSSTTEAKWVGFDRTSSSGPPNTTNAYKVNILAIGTGPGV